jgi:cytochrome c oxidase subunit 3
MSSHVRHPYHLVDESPWPLISSVRALVLVIGLVKAFFTFRWELSFLGLFLIGLVMYQWWKDVSHEATFQGHHSSIVELGLRWGIILFIISEVFFFISFFWAFFHRRLSPSPELGRVWPPIGIDVFNPFMVPLLNTIVLLSSGIRVTWSHHALIQGNHDSAVKGLVVTVLLGLYFTALQAIEYYEASFSIADRVYGSRFFIATGFHGFHVIVGTSFLLVCLVRMVNSHFSFSHHFGFEAAAWYWHFVDVVWLFLFVSIYWWGGA